MHLFNWLHDPTSIGASIPQDDGFSSSTSSLFSGLTSPLDDGGMINPATGLPMIDGMCGTDVAGNLFGTDSSSMWSESCSATGSLWDDHCSSTGSMFNDW